MTRILNGSLATHIALDATTLCHCWEITLTNGTIIRLTDHDDEVTLSGNEFTSNAGFEISMLESGENLAIDNAELTVLLQSSFVERTDIVNGFYDGARVKIYLVNWADPLDYCALPGGYLTKLKDTDREAGVFELTGLASKLNQKTGRVLQNQCDADVGDSRCGVNLASYTTTGTVTTATSRSEFADSANAEAADYFAYGKVTWTSGDNNGIISEVKTFSSGAFVLMTPTPSQIAVGDSYSATAGCDRRGTTCKTKFTNYTNFRGFPFVPTTAESLRGPNS